MSGSPVKGQKKSAHSRFPAALYDIPCLKMPNTPANLRRDAVDSMNCMKSSVTARPSASLCMSILAISQNNRKLQQEGKG